MTAALAGQSVALRDQGAVLNVTERFAVVPG
jgi:hypothetical protein